MNFGEEVVQADGDCLCASVQKALQSIGESYEISDLRNAVAERVLDPKDSEMRKIVQTWIFLYRHEIRDANNLKRSDYSHVAGASTGNKTGANLTEKDKDIIYRNMMSKSFWGEEVALSTLQRALECRFLIISYDNQSQKPMAMCPVDNKKESFQTFIILTLRGRHYQPAYYYKSKNKKTFILLKCEVPFQLIKQNSC